MGRHAKALRRRYRRRWPLRPRPVLVQIPALVLPDRAVDRDAEIVAQAEDDVTDPDGEELILDIRVVEPLVEIGEQILPPSASFALKAMVWRIERLTRVKARLRRSALSALPTAASVTICAFSAVATSSASSVN
jgi:hypothetical protein